MSTTSGFAYSVFCHARWGQTIGKRVMGVRVIDVSEEARATVRQALLRDSVAIVLVALDLIMHWENLLWGTRAVYDPRTATTLEHLFHFALFAWFALELITALYSRKRRSLHDWLAGTVVVRTR